MRLNANEIQYDSDNQPVDWKLRFDVAISLKVGAGDATISKAAQEEACPRAIGCCSCGKTWSF